MLEGQYARKQKVTQFLFILNALILVAGVYTLFNTDSLHKGIIYGLLVFSLPSYLLLSYVYLNTDDIRIILKDLLKLDDVDEDYEFKEKRCHSLVTKNERTVYIATGVSAILGVFIALGLL